MRSRARWTIGIACGSALVAAAALLVSAATGGVGLDGLQERATTLVWYDNSFDWELKTQGNGRVWREGQTRPVVYFECVWAPVDRYALRLLSAKKNVAELLVAGSISREDL